VPRLSDPTWLALLAAFEAAILRRDKRETYRIAARLHKLQMPDVPIDLWRVKAVARTYAADLYGWDMEQSDAL
jgi:hypothetical protein